MLLQRVAATAVAAILLAYSSPPSALAQMKDTTTGHQMPREMDHGMFRRAFGDWQLAGMAQVFPVVTGGALNDSENGPLRRTEWYLTQPALMANLESPSGRLVLRTTFNFEGLTLDGGELTLGGWGEGFIDRRHPPHTPPRVHAEPEPVGGPRHGGLPFGRKGLRALRHRRPHGSPGAQVSHESPPFPGARAVDGERDCPPGSVES